MPNWKKLITSGSDAALNSLIVSGTVESANFGNTDGSSIYTGSFTGSLLGNSSTSTTASYVDIGGLGGFTQGGNSFGTTATLGTNDNNSLEIETNGTTKMVVLSGGNVGIGTTNPGAKLELYSDSFSLLNLKRSTVSDYSIQLGGAGELYLYDNLTTQYSLTVNNGNIGIGTATPGTKLEISGTDALLELNTTSATGNPFLLFSQAGTRRSYIQHVDSEDNLTLASEYGAMRFMTGTGGTEVERVRITSAGNVGIDTTNPSGDLGIGSISTTAVPRSVYLNSTSTGGTGGQSSLYLATSAGGTGEIGFGRSQFASINLAGFIKYTDATDTFTFRTNFGDRMSLNSTGDLGIGTTSPAAKLDVEGDVLIKAANLSNQENLAVDTGTEVVATVPIATYTAAFFDYVVKNGVNLRSGVVFACHDGTNVTFTETSTSDLGSTTPLTLSVDISGGNMRLLATETSGTWSVKTLVRAL